jgi:hypothetical protein
VEYTRSKLEAAEANKKIIEGRKICYLSNLSNIPGRNLTRELPEMGLEEGTTLTNATKLIALNNTSLLTQKNKLKNTSNYFLRRGIGSKLLKFVIKDMSRKCFDVMILHAASTALERYYEDNFGFQAFPGPVVLAEGYNGDPPVYYGEFGNGHMMYLNLTRSTNNESACASTRNATMRNQRRGRGAGAGAGAGSANANNATMRNRRSGHGAGADSGGGRFSSRTLK